MTTALVYWLEMLCYTGNILSGIIAYNIWNMQEKTHINKFFLVYFAIDCSIGIVEPYFLFKVQKERLVIRVRGVLRVRLITITIEQYSDTIEQYTIMLRYDGELQQERNCIYFLAIWMVWETQRQLYNSWIMFIR